MRKKILMPLFHVGYYVLCLLFYVGGLIVSTLAFRFTSGLGGVVAVAYGQLFLVTPIIVVVLARFSLLKWYVDPIAAAEIPLLLYVGAIYAQMHSWGISFYDSFLKYNEKLSADGGIGWLFLLVLFVIGLAASFSPARKRGESISYRAISKFLA